VKSDFINQMPPDAGRALSVVRPTWPRPAVKSARHRPEIAGHSTVTLHMSARQLYDM